MQNEHLITENEYNEIFSKTEQDLYQAYLQKREVEGWKKVLPNTELSVDNIQAFIEKATEWNGGEIYTWHTDGMNGKFGLDEENEYNAKSIINWEELIQYLKENEKEAYNLHVYGDYASIEFDVNSKGVEISGFNDINGIWDHILEDFDNGHTGRYAGGEKTTLEFVKNAIEEMRREHENQKEDPEEER